jgi:hypothetical protein
LFSFLAALVSKQWLFVSSVGGRARTPRGPGPGPGARRALYLRLSNSGGTGGALGAVGFAFMVISPFHGTWSRLVQPFT